MSAMPATDRRPPLAPPAPPATAGASGGERDDRCVDWHEITAHRRYLVAFARRRLLDPALAEDLVHDVFEAVASGRARFGGRAALRSWLVGILKHKIVDLVRQRSGQLSLDAEGPDGETLDIASAQPGPEEMAEQRQRLRRTLAAIATLPQTLRTVVERRVLDDAPTAELCDELAISEANLFVRLHRARKALAAAA